MAELANDVVGLKKQLESLISEYIKVLNSTVSTHVEIYDMSMDGSDELDPKIRGFVENNFDLFQELQEQEEVIGNIDSINRLLSKELTSDRQKGNSDFFGEGIINCFNFLYIEDRKCLCFVRFSGFEKGVVSLFKETLPYPFVKDTSIYSFVRFLMHRMFELLRNKEYEQLEGQNKGDYISSVGREFMRVLLSGMSTSSHITGNVWTGNDLFDEFNYISTLNYEGDSVSAKLLIINKEEMDKHINFYIKLDKPINYNQHRRVRKLLETSDKKTFLIGDHENIYGLGTLQEYEALKNKSIFIIDFMGKLEYKISILLISRKVIEEKTRNGIENVEWCLNEQPVLFIRYGTPNLKENKFSADKLKEKLQKIFDTEETKIEEHKLESMIAIVKYAAKQRSGTTIVITKSRLAESEIENLEYQAIRINKTNLTRKNKYELKNIIDRITCIDGAVYLDIDGNCYAIGVILDGIAEKNQGDSSRGARYNSAVRYVNKQELKNNCVIVVISEDGMIDIIPDSEEKEEELNQLTNQLFELINKEQFQEALNLIDRKQIINSNLSKKYFLEGYIYDKKGDFKKSIEMYNKSIELDQGFALVYNNLAYVYNKEKENEKALEKITKAIDLEQNNADFYYNRAHIYKRLKKYEKATIDFSKAIELNPKSSDSYEGRGNTYVELEEYKKAVEDYERAIEFNPKNIVLYTRCGDSYEELEEYEKSIVKYEKAIELNPKETSLYTKCGDLYKKLGNDEKAQEKYEVAMELDQNQSN